MDQETEVWKYIPGYEGEYQVSNLGRVKSFRRSVERIIKLQTTGHHGYVIAQLYTGKIHKKYRVHRLVLQAFKPVENMEELQVNHIDGNKENNTLSNLEWCTGSDNVLHLIARNLNLPNANLNKTKSGLYKSDLVKIRRLITLGFNDSSIAHIFDTELDKVRKIRRWMAPIYKTQ